MTTTDPTTDTRWCRVRELFDQAIAHDGAARDAWLRAAADDEAIYTAASRLVHVHDAFTSTTDTIGGAIVADAIDDLIARAGFVRDDIVGGFRIERLIGEGGMGRVYLATRPVGGALQHVALKVVPFVVNDPRTIERLRLERAILATLEHPNIARLIDAGELPDERPYFAMEYVDGVAITRYCDERGLDLRARLALFADACEAVAYAHRRLVLHRDLKPGNILVDARGRVRLVDFGIAKSLNGASANADAALQVVISADATVDGSFFSLSSAAPEQVLGRATSVATDVYGLGCVLHEMLAGAAPFRFADATRESIVDIIAHRPAAPASETARTNDVAAQRRQCANGAALTAALRGDLDAIVSKSLRKEAAERYRSVDDLVADVRNVLAFRPIVARTSEWRYRVACFVRRHRLTALVAAVLGAAVLVATALSFVQYRRASVERDRAVGALAAAELQRDHARRVTRFLVDSFEAADPVKARGRELRADELLASAVASLEKNPSTGEPVLRATIAQTLAHLFYTLDRLPESVRHARIARDAFDEVAAPPAALAMNQGLTDAEAAFVEARYGDAIAAAGAALALAGGAADNGDLVYHLHLVRNRATSASGRYRDAAQLYQASVAALSRRGDVGVERIDRLRQLHAQVLTDNDRNPEARALLEALLAEQRARGSRDDPTLTETLRLLSHVHLRMSAARAEAPEHYRRSSAYTDEALARHRAMYGEDNALGAHLLLNHATLLVYGDALAQTEKAYLRAIDVGVRRIGARSAFVVLSYTRLSQFYRDGFGDMARAEWAAEKAVAASPPEGSVSRAAALMVLANLQTVQGRRVEARYNIEIALSLLSPEHLERAFLAAQLAYLDFRQYRFDEAAARLTPYVVQGVRDASPFSANRDRYAQLDEMLAFFRFVP